MWRPIETAPKDTSVLLARVGMPFPMFCGRLRYGNSYEPQQDELVWRCDSSGRFGNPTHWMPLPEPPE